MDDGAALEKRWAMSLVGSNPTLSAILNGEVLEWTIRRAWRARVAIGDRGFESHPLRQVDTHIINQPIPQKDNQPIDTV